MISENIKKLRIEKSLTQKELAEKLHVTSQAVSRWETGDVEPSIDTITEMSKIFEVSVDEIVNGKKPPEATPQFTEPVVTPKPVLAVCEQCNKPIYNGNEIVRKTVRHGRSGSSTTVICKQCNEENVRRAHDNAVSNGLLQRKRSFLWSTIITVAILLINLAVVLNVKMETTGIIASFVVSALFFPFFSCLFLKNNFIGDMFLGVCSWGFIKLPRLIFTLDLDGIIWLLTVKLAFWILGLLLSVFCFFLALALSLALSIFVYPFALRKNLKNPELTDII